MTPLQCKMARLGLGWTLDDLAQRAGVGRDAAARFELGKKARSPVSEGVKAKLEGALTSANVRLTRKAGFISVTVPDRD